jgi:hypothetical protein
MLKPAISDHVGKYVVMTKKSAERQSMNFVHCSHWDDFANFPMNHNRQGGADDRSFKNYRGWTRYKWAYHDFRLFGFWTTIRKHWHDPFLSRRGERIFAGKDEVGNKYWFTWDGTSSFNNRWYEAPDTHPLRAGADPWACVPKWIYWLAKCHAHTPAQIAARGEWGPHGRNPGKVTPFNVLWDKDMLVNWHSDPGYLPSNWHILSPYYEMQREAAFTRYGPNRGMPVHMPMVQPHDIKPEVVEDFWRNQQAWCRWSRGQDHDEWKN